MTPYYDDGTVQIWHGDCRELLPQLDLAEVGAVITDPPYGIGLYPSDTDALTPDLFRRLASFGTFAVFGWPEKLASYIAATGQVPDEWVTWWPTNAACRGFNPNGLLREAECIAIFGEANWKVGRTLKSRSSSAIANSGFIGRAAKLQDGSRYLGDVWTDVSPGLGFNSHQRLHPNQKPLPVLVRLVEAIPGVVLDPFMGSGTTLRAAKDLGRSAIGIEVDERYCEIAVARLAQDVLPFSREAS